MQKWIGIGETCLIIVLKQMHRSLKPVGNHVSKMKLLLIVHVLNSDVIAWLITKKVSGKSIFLHTADERNALEAPQRLSGRKNLQCFKEEAGRRKYAADKKGKDTYTIITLKNSFHGRTITTLSATGQDVFHADFTPMTEGFVYAEANNIESVKALVKEHKIAAIMFELVQGEGGVLPLDKDFVKGLAEIAQENDILLIADEVQTGNGRTGTLYAYMQYGITPDIVSTAKGLGGGLPIGACLLGEKLQNVLTAGTHGSTFGGNPISCAGALNVLSRIDEKLLSEVREKSAYIFETMQNTKGVKSVSGLGLMIGIETEKDASAIIAECRENGVLVIKAKNKLRLLPPLNIPMETLTKALNVIKAAL